MTGLIMFVKEGYELYYLDQFPTETLRIHDGDAIEILITNPQKTLIRYVDENQIEYRAWIPNEYLEPR